MTATTFDTLKFARTLRDRAHFTNEQAEGMAEAISEVVQNDIATKTDIESLRISTNTDIESLRISTKTDIESLRISTNTDIESLRISTKADIRECELRLETKIEATKAEIIKWMFGSMGLQTIVIIGAVIGLIRMLKP
jgi:hypothetical protein